VNILLLGQYVAKIHFLAASFLWRGSWDNTSENDQFYHNGSKLDLPSYILLHAVFHICHKGVYDYQVRAGNFCQQLAWSHTLLLAFSSNKMLVASSVFSNHWPLLIRGVTSPQVMRLPPT
jgi:hypothetical protein